MREIPTKLKKYLSSLDELKRNDRLELFFSLYNRAKEANIQNARHWAMRQILSERPTKVIEKRFAKLSKTKID